MSQPNPYHQQIDQLKQQIQQTQELAKQDASLSGLAQEEITRLQVELAQLESASQLYDEPQTTESQVTTTRSNCTIEFRPGTGGEEAKIWADDLMRMYSRFIELTNFRLTFVDDNVIKISGKTLFVLNENDGEISLSPYELFRYETGVHRVQRVPETESQGRVHTSTATVAVLPEVPPHAVVIRDEDLEWQFMRSSGAGGQSVNKTNSAVRLTHRPTELVVTARSERSQAQNRNIALDLLRSQIWEVEEEKRLRDLGEARSGIGRAMRAEKIRTYNFPQNRVTDHRTKQSWYSLETIVGGELTKLLQDLHSQISQSSENVADGKDNVATEDFE